MSWNFTKMHGLGNDFIILDLRADGAEPAKGDIIAMSDRKTGIGCDQFITILPSRMAGSDCFMRIYNGADGAEVEACGNATRCVADILLRAGGKDGVRIQTQAGILVCERAEDGMVRVDMGPARLDWAQIPLSEPCDTLHLPIAGDPVGVSVGNPHCVFFQADDVTALDLAAIGPALETHALFPNKTNVEFCNVQDRGTIRMRVWERGAGETQACGTGACASVIAGVRRGLVDRDCKVILDGGILHFHWDEKTGHIHMTGPVAYAFKGQWCGA